MRFAMALENTAISELAQRLPGRVYGPDGYAEEIAGFNLAVVHRPELVVAARSAEDVAVAVRFARERRLRVTVQSTGHGAEAPIESGLLISTRALNSVQVDPQTKRATVGAGVQWGAVVAASAPHGLLPITGSSPTVGVVGLLVGGGLGPLARSHGFASDYVTRFTVVTGHGALVEASAETNPDLFWALRGGKGGLGIVTEMELQLAKVPALYAGALYFAEDEIEAAFRAWVDWTRTADTSVTTSAMVVRFPPIDAIPAPFRGRRVLALRFTLPADAEAGQRLAAPLRAAAPVYLDALGPMALADVAKIHNDPVKPVPSWVRGALLTHVDQDFATAVLAEVGKGTSSPLFAVEVRHIGEKTKVDVSGGSAVGGRSANYTIGYLGGDPSLFATAVPAAAERFEASLARFVSPETNINFAPRTREQFARAWSAETTTRLADVRKRYDPDGLFPFGFSAAS